MTYKALKRPQTLNISKLTEKHLITKKHKIFTSFIRLFDDF